MTSPTDRRSPQGRRSEIEPPALPIIGLGCSRIGSIGNEASTKQSERLLNAALDMGVQLFDTADVYGQGDSERAIGRVLRKRRDAAFVVTKVGKTFSSRMERMRPLKRVLRPLLARSELARGLIVARRRGEIAHDFSPRHVDQAIDASLGRLNCDRIDGLLLHGPSTSALMDPYLHEILIAARHAGRIHRYGVSCDTADTLAAAIHLPGASLIQIEPDLLEEACRLCAFSPNRIEIILRGVVRRRGPGSAAHAVRSASELPGVSSVLIGTGSVLHLREAVDAVRSDSFRAERTEAVV